MAITPCLTNSFITEILRAEHDFTASTGHVFKMALYVTATMGKTTTAYTVTDEVSGDGYTAAGLALTSVTPTYDATASICDFSPDATWGSSTITAEGAMIYNTNSTLVANASVMLLDFGGSKSSSNGDFTVQFPAAAAATAIIRITN